MHVLATTFPSTEPAQGSLWKLLRSMHLLPKSFTPNNFDHMDEGEGLRHFLQCSRGVKNFFTLFLKRSNFSPKLYIAASLIIHYFVLLK